ncbi:MAG: S1 RNA-binding domain-containing protein [Patescibacteria group bacterium]
MTKKDNRAMAALLAEDEIPAPPTPGQPVTGKVVNISNGRILVEIDGTYTGIIAGREAIDGFDTAKNLVEGDEVTAYVVEAENEDGYYVLSLRKASREKAWVKLQKMVSSDDTIEVTIREANKGGLMTDFNGIRAFIPVSQLAPEHYPRVNGANSSEILSKLQKFVGEKFVVQVLTAVADENKLILSEKAGLAKKREAALSKLSVGDKIKGKVTGIVNFGIFIMFGDGLEGLVHLSEVAWGKVTDAASYARVGEEKEAVVIGISPDKISLSMKRLTTDPWLKNIEKFSVGDEISGPVEKITPFGAIVKLADDVSGLLHSSENEENVELNVGDEVVAKIIEINPDEHRIALSMKDNAKPKKKKAVKKEETKDDEEVKEEKPKKKPAAKKTKKSAEREE